MPGTVSDVSATLVASTMRRPAVGLEDPVLLGRATAGRRAAGPRCRAVRGRPQRVGGVADLALAAEEHEHVARRLGAQLVDGVDDRLHLVAVVVVASSPNGR